MPFRNRTGYAHKKGGFVSIIEIAAKVSPLPEQLHNLLGAVALIAPIFCLYLGAGGMRSASFQDYLDALEAYIDWLVEVRLHASGSGLYEHIQPFDEYLAEYVSESARLERLHRYL